MFHSKTQADIFFYWITLQKHGNECLYGDPNDPGVMVGDEDCLYLNVFTRHPGDRDAREQEILAELYVDLATKKFNLFWMEHSFLNQPLLQGNSGGHGPELGWLSTVCQILSWTDDERWAEWEEQLGNMTEISKLKLTHPSSRTCWTTLY